MTSKTTTTPKKPKSTFLSIIAAIIAGLQKSPPAGVKSASIQGQTFTIAQLITNLLSIQQVQMAPAPLKVSYSQAVAAAKAQRTAMKSFIDAVIQALTYLYGTDTAGLSGCGITPKKARAQMTPEQKTIAKAKAAATRNAKKAAVPVTPTDTVTVTDATGQVIGQTGTLAPSASPAAGAVNGAGAVGVPAAGAK